MWGISLRAADDLTKSKAVGKYYAAQRACQPGEKYPHVSWQEYADALAIALTTF